MRQSARFALMALLVVAAACSSDGPTQNRNVPASIVISGGTSLAVGALGSLQLSALVLDANRVELPPTTYTVTWSSLDPAVAASAGSGVVTVLANGTARIVARVGTVADTIQLMVQQVATRITFAQDTAVALLAGATRLSGDALPSDTLAIVAHRADANGNAMAGGAAITWTASSGDVVLAPNAAGDTLKIIGTATGSGTLTARASPTVSATLVFQVVDQYAVVRMSKPSSPGATTVLTPSTVTIPAGAAVVFRSADQDLHAAIATTGQWRTAPVQGPAGREAQRFGVPGTYDYRVETTAGTVVVQ